MAISVDWATKVITVPKADTTLVDAGPPEIRSYDVYEKLWKELKAIEDDEVGMPFDDTQRHITTSSLGGVLFAHQVEIINGFTVTFEAGAYQINLVGANHNVLDVTNIAANPALRSSNSAGLIIAETGVSGLTPTESAALISIAANTDFIKEMESGEWKIEGNQMIFYDSLSVEIARFDLKDEAGNPASENVYRRIPV